MYERIRTFFFSESRQTLTFTKLIPSDKKEDKIYTFIPLLHLHNQRKIDLDQEHFLGEIDIHLLGNKGAIEDVEEEVVEKKDESQKDKKSST